MNIFNYSSYHFIGIGGIGISAIARMLHVKGKKVTGSDNSKSLITDDLEKLGISVSIPQNAENIPIDAEVVIYTIAIPEKNPELSEARKRNLIVISYPEALGELSKSMTTIAISGTHGKTTVTAMIGHILKENGLDPTIIVGSKMLGENSNFHAGKSDYLVVEACEYKRSFLNLHPSLLVINNLEEDHLDYYKDITDIQNAFSELALKVPENGFIITTLKDLNVEKILKNTKAKILDYSSISEHIDMKVPGRHNILNAQAAVQTAVALGIPEEKAKESLATFQGTWRRLEYKAEKNNALFYDDYAHHPTEIHASLSALKEKYPDRKIVCVFEPHQYSRTKLLFNEFVQALKIANYVFIAPIFLSREDIDPSISNKILAEAISKFTSAKSIENPEELKIELEKLSKEKTCIVFMGAGDIYTWTEKVLM